jgi:hypothetical protein
MDTRRETLGDSSFADAPADKSGFAPYKNEGNCRAGD